jgi:hypothetical protein
MTNECHLPPCMHMFRARPLTASLNPANRCRLPSLVKIRIPQVPASLCHETISIWSAFTSFFDPDLLPLNTSLLSVILSLPFTWMGEGNKTIKVHFHFISFIRWSLYHCSSHLARDVRVLEEVHRHSIRAVNAAGDQRKMAKEYESRPEWQWQWYWQRQRQRQWYWQRQRQWQRQ